MSNKCDCDINELLEKAKQNPWSNGGYYSKWGNGGYVFCEKHGVHVPFEWISEEGESE